jgi:hypothetical protein
MATPMVGQGVQKQWEINFDGGYLVSCKNLDYIKEMWKRVLSWCTKE